MSASRVDDATALEAEVRRLRERVAKFESERLRPSAIAEWIAEHSADNIMLLGPDLTIRYINWTVPEFTREQVIGTYAYRYVPADCQTVVKRCFERIVKTKAPGRYESTFVSESGEVSYWESRVAPIIDGDEVVGFTQISSNVSERNAAAADRDRFFNLSVDLLAIAGTDGFFKRINPAFERILGYDPEELLAKPFVNFVHPDDVAEAHAALRHLERGQPLLDFESRYRHKDGSYRIISWRVMPDPQRRILYGVGRDVTEQRELEHQLRHSQKMEAVGRFAGGLAHDFNNLLMTIAANARFATSTSSDASSNEEHLEVILGATSRAAELTRQLLTFGQRQPLERVSVDVGGALSDLVRLIRRLIPENIEIRVEASPSLPRIKVDRVQIEQVLLNLTLNARDAMPDGGELVLRAEEVAVDERFQKQRPWATSNAFIRIAVCDTGAGMTAEVRERAFEPFFTTKTTGEGSGLGLASAYAIAQRHGGGLTVTTEPGEGTTFELYLPIAPEPSVLPRPGQPVPSEPARGETILVAEDERGVLEAVAKMLSDAGYSVLAVSDGDEAQRVFSDNAGSVSLVLLDVVMPKVSGRETLRFIRQSRPDIPAIFMSGYPGACADLDDFGSLVLSKPFAPEELLLCVRSKLDEAPADKLV